MTESWKEEFCLKLELSENVFCPIARAYLGISANIEVKVWYISLGGMLRKDYKEVKEIFPEHFLGMYSLEVDTEPLKER